MSDELDPEISALLNKMPQQDSDADIESLDDPLDEVEELEDDSLDSVNPFGAAPQKQKSSTAMGPRTIHDVDLSKTCFEPIEQIVNDTPSDDYNDPKYYKVCLTGENQSAQRVHQILTKYLTTADPKDRSVFRQQIVTAYWELLRGMVGKMSNMSTPLPKRMLVRFGIILPTLFKPEAKEFFSKMIMENKYNEPVLYVDEWFKEIASGRMGNSATDEAKRPKPDNPEAASKEEKARLMQLKSKNSGRLQSAENILNIKENERKTIEGELTRDIKQLCTHAALYGMEPHTAELNEEQRKLFPVIADLLRRLSRNDKEFVKAFAEYKEAKATFDSVSSKVQAAGGDQEETNDTEAVKLEFETYRQMAKMTVGRRGNQFPLFTREFFHCTENGTGMRENVIETLRWIESLDPGAFVRLHKNVPNRIVPYVLLVPTYGDRGFCWEPFDRYNRVTSRGRIVVPMYPRDLKIAVLTAVADLRWQVAKEKASYYWMEEGLTGQYYQHVEQMKLKGDLKEFFIEDYILWMTKESTGVQRLDKDVRGIFWRNMPFPKELKEELRKRSLVYDELCKKDLNREMSDGY
ncbi:MAG: hypothetical protein IJR80_05505 [Treponema sp.]|nr:hypothetical protein [Treponema sp.]